MTAPSPSFLGKEEAHDEEKNDGKAAPRTIKTCPQSLCFTNASWCHLSSKIFIFYSFLLSLSFLFDTQEKTSLITLAWNKEIPQLCMALEVTFFLFSFLSLNLCMSLWFYCSHTAIQRQSCTKSWNKNGFLRWYGKSNHFDSLLQCWTWMSPPYLNSFSVFQNWKM